MQLQKKISYSEVVATNLTAQELSGSNLPDIHFTNANLEFRISDDKKLFLPVHNSVEPSGHLWVDGQHLQGPYDGSIPDFHKKVLRLTKEMFPGRVMPHYELNSFWVSVEPDTKSELEEFPAFHYDPSALQRKLALLVDHYDSEFLDVSIWQAIYHNVPEDLYSNSGLPPEKLSTVSTPSRK